MARLMSVNLTEPAVLARTKTVTRRTGWTFLRVGDRLQLCRKVMGRRPGEPLVRLALVEVVDVRRERLDTVTAADVDLEGLAPMTPDEFVAFFCATHKHVAPDTVVTRIQWRYLDETEDAAGGGAGPDGPASPGGGSAGHTAAPQTPPATAVPVRQVRFVALGAGVQSTAVLLMVLEGELTADFAVFADTGWEPPAVYRHLWGLAERCAEVGFPLYVVADGDIRARHLDPAGVVTMPLYIRQADGRRPGRLHRQCTDRAKVRPINRFLRDYVGGSWRGVHVTRLMGISWDEIERMKPARERWATAAYPLIDRRMTRADCLAWCAARNVHPPRSSCIGCPMHSPAEWRRIRDHDPASFAEAVAFDQALRAEPFTAGRAGRALRGPVFLHRSGHALDTPGLLDNEEDRGQLTLFGCDEGWCGL